MKRARRVPGAAHYPAEKKEMLVKSRIKAKQLMMWRRSSPWRSEWHLLVGRGNGGYHCHWTFEQAD